MNTWIILRAEEDASEKAIAKMAPDVASGARLLSQNLPEEAVADLVRDPRTLAAAPSMPTALIEPLKAYDEQSAAPWGLSATGADQSLYDGAGVIVAVLDTGIDLAHPAFHGVEKVTKDWSGSGIDDRRGHGTHCAGTILGRDVGARIGIARGVERVVVGKIMDDEGRGTSLAAIDGIRWAIENGAQVISLSIGLDLPGMARQLMRDGWPEEQAMAVAIDAYRRNLRLFDRQMDLIAAEAEFGRDALVVAAAGNASRRNLRSDFVVPASLPAAAIGVLSVAAVGRATDGLRVAEFSNSMASLCAPGVSITSAWPGGGLKTLSGTSMAAPHVAGVAALWWHERRGSAGSAEVKTSILANAETASLAPGWNATDVGRGLARAP